MQPPVLEPLAQVLREIEGPGQLLAAGSSMQMLQGCLAGGQQQTAGAGGLQPQQGPLQASRRHPLARPLEQHGTLGQASSRLLQRLHHQIRPTAQATGGQPGIQAEMGAMGLIQQHRQLAAMGASDQGGQIAHQALVAGGHQNHGGQGTLRQGGREHPLKMVGRGRPPQARGGVEGQGEQHRPQLAEQATMQQGTVQVAGQQHPLPRLGQPQQCSLQEATGTIHPKPAPLGPEQLGQGGLALGHGPFRLQRTADLGQLR